MEFQKAGWLVDTTAAHSVYRRAGHLVADLAGSWVALTVETRAAH